MNAKMNFGQKNGVFFEELFLSKLQELMKVQSSDGTQFKYCCDIVADDCLIEIKSHRDWKQTETTQQVFTSILQSSFNKIQTNGVPSGLVYQLTHLLNQVRTNKKKAIVIAGVYNEEVNQLYQLFLKDGDRAFAKYKLYDILLIDQDWSGLCRISSTSFWTLIKYGIKYKSLFDQIRFWIEDINEYSSLLYRISYSEDVVAMYELMKHCTIAEVDEQNYSLELGYTEHTWGHDNVGVWGQDITEEKQSEINIEKQQIEIHVDKSTQTWIEKEKQEKAEAEPVEAVAERTDGYTYPIIEQDKCDVIRILEPENLKKIEEGIRNQVKLRDLSLDLGYSPVYLTGTITSDRAYKSKNWLIYKKWILNLMDEVGYDHKPTASIDSIESAQEQVRKYRTQVSNYEIKLEKQAKKHKEKLRLIHQEVDHQKTYANQLLNKNKELQAQLDSQETNQVDETTTLKLEAYQAEIKKLQAEIKECTQYKNEFTEIKKSDEIKIESLQNLCSKQLRELTQLKTEIKNIKLEQQETVVSNGVQEDLNRYKRIIDLLLDK
jgi:hypothetical protein